MTGRNLIQIDGIDDKYHCDRCYSQRGVGVMLQRVKADVFDLDDMDVDDNEYVAVCNICGAVYNRDPYDDGDEQ